MKLASTELHRQVARLLQPINAGPFAGDRHE